MIRRRLNGIYDSTPSFENSEELDRLSIPVHYHGHYTGLYGQCIEYVRRFLIQHYSVTFPSVRNANELFRRSYEPQFFECIFDQTHGVRRTPRVTHPHIPRTGDLVFMHYPRTGHVGVVTGFNRVTDEVIIADQNYEYGLYWMDNEYAYTLPRTSREIIGFVRLT